MVYKRNGVHHVAHVGTHDSKEDLNDAVKQAWNTFAQANLGDLVAGFNPLRHWQGNIDPPRESGSSKMLGLITNTFQLFAVAYEMQISGVGHRITGIQQIQSRPLSELYNIK